MTRNGGMEIELRQPASPPVQDASERGRGRSSSAKTLEEFQALPVDWLFDPYIPRGEITMISGDPGRGKSYLTLALAAALSRGTPLAGIPVSTSGTTLLFVGEDSIERTVKPRATSMGADTTRIVATAEIQSFSQLDLIEHEIERHRPDLVVFDPLTTFLGGKMDMNVANQARSVLRPISRLASRYDCAIVIVRHLNKGNAKGLYRGQGSIDFTALARSEILVGRGPNGDSCAVHSKSNLGPKGCSLGFRPGEEFQWLGPVDVTEDELLADVRPRRSKVADAGRFLNEFLGEGPRPVAEIIEAASQAGISQMTLRRAKSQAGVRVERLGEPGRVGGGKSVWQLVDQDDQEVDQDRAAQRPAVTPRFVTVEPEMH